MLSTEQKNMAYTIATEILRSNKNYLSNIRAMYNLAFHAYGTCWDTEFHIFALIESETDSFPDEECRPLYNAKFLQKLDKELEHTINTYRQAIQQACHEIIRLHGPQDHSVY